MLLPAERPCKARGIRPQRNRHLARRRVLRHSRLRLLQKRQFEVAIEQFNKAINHKPSAAIYHLRLARALRDNGDAQKARQAYERALQLGGSNFTEAGQARQELTSLRRS
jgi:Tfp pilus assembly protein PilF